MKKKLSIISAAFIIAIFNLAIVYSAVVDVDGFVRKGATIEPGYLGSGIGISYIQDTGSSDQFVGALFSAQDEANYYFAFEQDVNNNDNS